jgi:nicotinate-nucleotide adenylyltransferase
MRIGLLGGSFNPPHYGHLHIAELALKKMRLNQVWLIPTKKNPFKKSVVYQDYQIRITACQKLIAKNPKIKVFQRDEIYTEKLVKSLINQYPKAEFFWIMGADNLQRFHQWGGFKRIIFLTPLAIFSREKFLLKIKKTCAWNFIKKSPYKIFATKNINISSSEIRNKNHEAIYH